MSLKQEIIYLSGCLAGQMYSLCVIKAHALFNLTSIWNRIITFLTCLQDNLIILRGHLKELVLSPLEYSLQKVVLSHVSEGDKVNIDYLQLFPAIKLNDK